MDRQFTDYNGVRWVHLVRTVYQGGEDTVPQDGVWIKLVDIGAQLVSKDPGCASVDELVYETQYTVPTNDSTLNWNYMVNRALVFEQWPLSYTAMCNSSRKEIWGLGYATTDNNYPRGIHNGIDMFVPDGRDVLSMDNGIIVGIGQNDTAKKIEDSHIVWGATLYSKLANPPFTPGYAVIVRYGHLYVLYGHLKSIEANIWLGAKVLPGQKIGTVGIFPGSDPHLHLEIHSYGAVALTPNNISQEGILPVDNTTSGEKIVAPFLYDAISFLKDPASTNQVVGLPSAGDSKTIALPSGCQIIYRQGTSSTLETATVNQTTYKGFTAYQDDNKVFLPLVSPNTLPSDR